MSWPARCPRQVPPGAMGTGVVGSIEPGLSQDVGGPAGAVGRRSCRLSTPEQVAPRGPARQINSGLH